MADGDAARALRGQFFSSYQMLLTFVDVCPDSVWEARFYGFAYPVWYQVYHVAYFVDYWLREEYDGSAFCTMAFDERIPPEFEHEVPEGIVIRREEMRAYLAAMEEKLGRFFDALTDQRLHEPIALAEAEITYTDAVVTQIRHIMYNVGYLNGILRGLDLQEADWYAYHEHDD